MEKRTPEELRNLKLNYYVVYNIAPTEKDSEKIGKAMAQLKTPWAQGNAEQRRLIELYDEAVAIMTNDASRKKEFQDAKRLKLEAAEKALAPIALRGNGAILKSYLVDLAHDSGKWFTVDELEKTIAHLLRSGARLVDDTQKNLDFLTYDKIKKNLDVIGKKDMYDLLDLPHSASPSELVSAAAAGYSKSLGNTNKNSKVTAAGTVCGIAKTVFQDPNKKKYYDAYLATKVIWDELQHASKIPVIDEKHFLDYIQQAKAALKTTDTKYVESLLYEGLRQFKITVVGEDSAAAKAEADKIKAEADRKLREAQDKIDKANADADRKLREAQDKIDKANADAARAKREADQAKADADKAKREADQAKADAAKKSANTQPTNTWPSPPQEKYTPPVSDDWTWTTPTPPQKKYTPPPPPQKKYTPPPPPSKKYTPPPPPQKKYTPPPPPSKGYTPPPPPKK